MKEHCWICKNTEDYFLDQKKELLNPINKQLAECDEFGKNIISSTAEKLGFTEDSKNIAKKINAPYTTMTLSAVLENKENFLQLEPALKTIYDYCEKYPDVKTCCKTVSDSIQKYLQEPSKDKYSRALHDNENKRKSLLCQKEKLEEIKTFFIEKELNDKMLNISNLGFKFNKKFYLCPICASLFTESAKGAFEVIEAKRRAEEIAMNWGDDDEEEEF